MVYGLIFDSTSDQAHRLQVLEVVRYVDIDFDKKTMCVKETFRTFFNFIKKMLQALLKLLCSNYGRMR